MPQHTNHPMQAIEQLFTSLKNHELLDLIFVHVQQEGSDEQRQQYEKLDSALNTLRRTLHTYRRQGEDIRITREGIVYRPMPPSRHKYQGNENEQRK